MEKTRHTNWPLALVIVLLVLFGLIGLGRIASGQGRRGSAPAALVQATVSPSYFSSLRWRSVGPYRGGRVLAVAGDPTDFRVHYLGATGGGVWKTTNAGQSWENVSDGYFKTGAVGAIAVSGSNPKIVYVGMGEACIRGDNSHGDGVYKTIDGGKTWQNVGLDKTLHIGRVAVDPKSPDIVFVAAFGDAWGPSPDRGVFRSMDGGATWKKVLFKSDRAGAVDLSMDQANPKIVYASIWQGQRYPWGIRSAGPDSGLYKTTDGGDSWLDISDHPGLPRGIKGRIGLAVSPVRPSRVWAIIEAEKDQNGVYRTDDGGATWQRVSSQGVLSLRPWYYHHIFADTKDPETVYVLNTSFYKSTDGGKTFSEIATPHGDNHALWVDPKDPQHMIEGNDGGAIVTLDAGKSWSSIYNQPTAQLYHVATDNRFPYRLYASQQDSGTISVPSRLGYGPVPGPDWYQVGGGEDGYVAVRPDNPDVIFAGDHHWVTRYNRRTGQVENVSPWPEDLYGWGARSLKYRFQWTYPIVLSPHDPNVLYATAQVVFRTSNDGQSWETISPDLTRHDPSKLEPNPTSEDDPIEQYWGPTTRDNTGIEWYSTIFAFAESPVQKGVLWTGSDDGLIHVSRDTGKHWENVTPRDLPEFALISTIDPSPHDAGTAYVAATRYKLQDTSPYLYKTTDYGKSWTKLTNGIPANGFTRVIREDPAKRGLLYAGTETAVYVSFDDGRNWESLQLNLPAVPIHDLVVHDSDLVVATHGRSFWILDDVSVLRQISDETLKAPLHLFKPRDTVRLKPAGRERQQFVGENPPSGAWVTYYLKDEPKQEISLAFLDKNGQTIREFSSQPKTRGETAIPARAGANRFVWDTRYPSATVVPGAFFHRGGVVGPVAPPGTYQVKLKVGAETQTQTFELVKDPRLTMSPQDFQQQFTFLLRIRDKLSEGQATVNRIHDARREIEGLVRNAAGKPNAARIVDAAKTIDAKLYAVEDQFLNHRAVANFSYENFPTTINVRLASLADFVASVNAPPTKQSYDVFNELATSSDQQQAKLKSILETDFAALHAP